jgi:F0F1-type ATP synthase assembly protein I
MNEHTARDVVLVRAIETADQKKEILSDDDRMYASRSARELAQWRAADRKADVTGDDFLQQRSEQILKRLAERTPAFANFIKRRNPLTAFSLALPLIALLLGAGLDRITDPHRVDLLSAPLLLIIGWNLLVYLGLLVWLFVPSRSRVPRRVNVPRKIPAVLSTALLNFMREWSQLSARLTSARLSRTVHLSAATFAIGALVSLYARGLLSQYAAGWESTFLDAGQVHSLLSFLFAPAVAVFHLQGFSLTEIEVLRFPQTTAAAGGARWVHLYAATILLLVVAPRLLLAAIGQWRATLLARRFPLDLDQPYFRKLNDFMGMAQGGMLRVLPYSFTVDEERHRGLGQIAVMLFGEQGRVMLRPSTSYGEEPQGVLRDDAEVTITAALFNLTATPEKENHGAFLDYLVRTSPRGVAVLLDESAYLERMGQDRLAERTALWQQFCRHHRTTATMVNLREPAAHPLDADLTLSEAA